MKLQGNNADCSLFFRLSERLLDHLNDLLGYLERFSRIILQFSFIFLTLKVNTELNSNWSLEFISVSYLFFVICKESMWAF